MFFPFPFLQLQTEESASGPPEEPIGVEEFVFREVDGNQYLIPATPNCTQQENHFPQGLQTEEEDTSSMAQTSEGELEMQDFDPELIREEITEGTRRLWEPTRNPWILEDLENQHKSVLWNLTRESISEVSTVGIVVRINEEDQLEWVNEEDFRLRYAPEICKSDNDIRTMYYILNLILDEVGEEQLAAAFSDAINIEDACWFYWRVAPENLSPETLRSTVTRMLNLGLTGRIYPFMTLYETEGTHDDAALLRAVQLAAFLPISVISTDTTRFADEMHLRTLHRTLERRRQLNGYIETLLHESLVTHEPIIRLMEYQYPGQGFADCTDQFMLGSDCLVAPLFDDAVQRTVRLPRGTWIATDGTKYRGPRVIRIDVSDGHMPVFVKQ